MSDRLVMTVLGPIAPSDLGMTITHEHLIVDLSPWFAKPEEASRRRDLNRPVDMSMLTDLRRRPMSITLDNMVLNDIDLAIEELRHYVRAGRPEPGRGHLLRPVARRPRAPGDRPGHGAQHRHVDRLLR